MFGLLTTAAPLYAADIDIDELLYQEALAAVASGERTRALSMLETLVLRQPRHAGAWLDLALLFCDLGEAAKSREILDRIEAEFDPSPVIRDLIALQRGRDCTATATTATPATGPLWSAGFQIGRDSNVNRGARTNRVVLESSAGPVVAQLADDALPKADGFGEGWAEALWRRGPRSLRLSLLARQYEQIKSFDTQALAATGEQAWASDPAEGAIRLQWAHVRLGGSAFLDALTASAGATGRSAWHGVRPAVEVALARNRFPAAPAFDAWVGSVRPGVTKSAPGYSWRANLIATADLAEGSRPGRDRYAMGAEAMGTWQPAPGIQLSGSGLVQQTRDQAPYFPPLLNTHRRQLVWLGRLEVAVEVGRGVYWTTSWTEQKSADNLPFLDHSARVLQSGLVVRF